MAVIGVMDSGSGGLSVLREIRKVLPEASYIYYADNANCPYGTKSREFILQRCHSICELLLSRGADAIVIACNTATAVAISSLREKYDVPFVGMEPAVKPAAMGTQSGVIGVLATAGTLSASKYLDMKDRYSDGVEVVEHVGEGFVELVERGVLSGPEAEKTCAASLMPLLEKGADIIVLGCTHYPFLRPVMEKICAERGYRGVRFIDPAPAVARRLIQVLEEKGIGDKSGVAACPVPGSVELLSSGPREVLEYLYSK
ncbi:MAG: glutamate racemase [Bacteroidales bacterium]|nr:glutamate racemase [Bacteroidales bacterium]